jgi:hypothetical protein
VLKDANQEIAPTEFVARKFAANTNATHAKNIFTHKKIK